jgi:hypothetical protein
MALAESKSNQNSKNKQTKKPELVRSWDGADSYNKPAHLEV